MQPVDASSGARSITAARATVPQNKVSSNNTVVEQIPIIEPTPHYPLSANVSEIMAHITELIKEQQEAIQEAATEKNIEQKRTETQELFVEGNADIIESRSLPSKQINTVEQATNDDFATSDDNAYKQIAPNDKHQSLDNKDRLSQINEDLEDQYPLNTLFKDSELTGHDKSSALQAEPQQFSENQTVQSVEEQKQAVIEPTISPPDKMVIVTKKI